MENILKQARLQNHFTQEQAANFLNISLRSYIMYENEPNKKGTMKYEYMLEKLKANKVIDEEHGLIEIEDIKKVVKDVAKTYPIEYCYLFGSYAKNKQKPSSDVDLLISTSVSGLKFYGLVEELREKLHKKVDLIKVNQLENNTTLLNEILKDGIKVYG